MRHVSGRCFKKIDNRIMSLHLVQCGLTNAVMFGQQCDVLQPSDLLHKKAIRVERGSVRPATHMNVEMINCATAQFVQAPLSKGKNMIGLMAITMSNPLSGGAIHAQDCLSRVDLLVDIGFTVLISN